MLFHLSLNISVAKPTHCKEYVLKDQKMENICEQLTCNISKNQLEISNIGEVVDNGIQNCEFVNLGVAETSLEQSYEKNHFVRKFKDINRNNEEIDLEAQTVASMTVSNGKNDSDISDNKKYTFPNASCSNILRQTSGIRRPSNLPAHVSQVTSPISQVNESDIYLTQGDQSNLETLEALWGSGSTSSKFLNGHINGTFVSDLFKQVAVFLPSFWFPITFLVIIPPESVVEPTYCKEYILQKSK